ncbi:MAG: TatD family hydrolase [Bacteroidales bacterium]
MYIDTHTHLYLDAFASDRDAMVHRAMDAGVSRMLLPNIDATTISEMFRLADRFQGICLPMMGLHPTSVNADYKMALTAVKEELDRDGVVAIGEIGIDLYWDRTYLREQENAFIEQLNWAREKDLPVVIHARESFREIFRVMDREGAEGLSGVFHSFTGTREELDKALSYGFMIGINGIVTFKNSGLSELVPFIPLERLLLETDAPFLAPVPHRGKRNESSYLLYIAERLAEIYNLTHREIATVTTRNATALFKLDPVHES